MAQEDDVFGINHTTTDDSMIASFIQFIPRVFSIQLSVTSLISNPPIIPLHFTICLIFSYFLSLSRAFSDRIATSRADLGASLGADHEGLCRLAILEGLWRRVIHQFWQVGVDANTRTLQEHTSCKDKKESRKNDIIKNLFHIQNR